MTSVSYDQVKTALGYVMGLDLGQLSDPSALGIIKVGLRVTDVYDVVPGYDLRYLERYPLRTSYPEIVRSVCTLYHRLPEGLVADSTGVGRPVVDMFREAGVSTTNVSITGGMQVLHRPEEPNEFHVPKRDLVGAVQRALQTRSLRMSAALAEVDTLQTELGNFELRISQASHDSYGAWREGTHDDLVLALAVALWFAQQILPQDSGVTV
jgi:hypothetical protein